MSIEITTVEEIDQMMGFIDENIEYVKSAFAIFDKKGTGTIPASSLGLMFRTLGLNPTEDDIDNFILDVDQDQDGVIDFIEFLEMMNRMWVEGDEAIREAFQVFDSDGSGSIDEREFRDVMETYLDEDFTERDITDMISSIDTDGDGLLSLDEFVKLLRD